MGRRRIIDEGVDASFRLIGRYVLARRAVWAAAVGMIAVMRSPSVAAPWVVGAIAVEIGCATSARTFLKGGPVRTFHRVLAVCVGIGSIAIACGLQATYWAMGEGAMRLLATAFIFVLLTTAQIFLARSRILFASSVTLTALTFFAEVGVFGGYHGFLLAGVLLCVTMSVVYSVVAGVINQRTNEALEASKREAEAANAAKSAFLAMMSHELRTPMNGVLGIAQALKLTDLTATQAEQVDLILASGEGLLSILGDVLDVSKIEAGRMELELTPFNLPALCEATVALWINVASARGVLLTSRLDPEAPAWVTGDPTRLRQIISNLVSNALKFTERGEVTVTLRTLAGAPEESARLQIEVSDTGIGLSQEQLGCLFQPFVQAEASTTRRFGGTGLGLSICKRLTEMMGGEIGVESREGEGTTFHIRLTLPLASAQEAASTEPAPAEVGGLRVLVVDDNATNRLVARTVLSSLDVAVETADDGLEALDALNRQAFDVVLMDIHMPRLDGIETLRRIRAGGSGRCDVPVIALTADAMEGDAQRLLAIGFDGVQPKPIRLAELVAEIAAVVHKDMATAPLALAS